MFKLAFGISLAVLVSGCAGLPVDPAPEQGVRVVAPDSGVVSTGRQAVRGKRVRRDPFELRKARLIHEFQTAEPVKRAHAAFWLGEMGSNAADAVPVLATGLDHSNIWVRRASARALGKIGAAGGVKPLIRALNDQNKWVRESVIIALRKIGTREARTAVRGKSING